MQLIKYPKREDWTTILARPTFDNTNLLDLVGTILKDIAKRGDMAVKEYELKFDNVQIDTLQVSEKEIAEAEKSVSSELKNAIKKKKNNIEKFHIAQQHEMPVVETMPGVTCWQKAMPIEKVGLYVPGGTAPLFSTVLMLANPAQIAQS